MLKKKKTLYCIIIMLLILFAVGTYCLLKHNNPQYSNQILSGDFLPPKKDASKLTDKQLASYAQKNVDKSKFQMIINPDIIVNKDTNISNLAIENPKNNGYPVAVTIKLNNGKKIYKSGAINVDYGVKNVKMDEELGYGRYDGVATFNVYDPVTLKEKGSVGTAVKITVE